MFTIKINPKDIEDIKKLLRSLAGDDANKALARGINKTMTGVRTDGVKILKDRYALTATAIRKSWKIRNAHFKDLNGVVSTQGTPIRLKEFGARKVPAGVSVKVLRTNPRTIVKHAFFAKLGLEDRVYRRKHEGARKKPVATRVYAKLPFKYRFPIHALYGPRIQDHLGDPEIIGTLQRMAGERLGKNMEHEVDYLLKQAWK